MLAGLVITEVNLKSVLTIALSSTVIPEELITVVRVVDLDHSDLLAAGGDGFLGVSTLVADGVLLRHLEFAEGLADAAGVMSGVRVLG